MTENLTVRECLREFGPEATSVACAVFRVAEGLAGCDPMSSRRLLVVADSEAVREDAAGAGAGALEIPLLACELRTRWTPGDGAMRSAMSGYPAEVGGRMRRLSDEAVVDGPVVVAEGVGAGAVRASPLERFSLIRSCPREGRGGRGEDNADGADSSAPSMETDEGARVVCAPPLDGPGPGSVCVGDVRACVVLSASREMLWRKWDRSSAAL